MISITCRKALVLPIAAPAGSGSYRIEYKSVANNERTWVSYGIDWNWASPEGDAGHEFLHEAIQVKNIWGPTGE